MVHPHFKFPVFIPTCCISRFYFNVQHEFSVQHVDGSPGGAVGSTMRYLKLKVTQGLTGISSLKSLTEVLLAILQPSLRMAM